MNALHKEETRKDSGRNINIVEKSSNRGGGRGCILKLANKNSKQQSFWETLLSFILNLGTKMAEGAYIKYVRGGRDGEPEGFTNFSKKNFQKFC